MAAMATAPTTRYLFFFFITILIGAFFTPGFAAEETVPQQQWDSNSSPSIIKLHLQSSKGGIRRLRRDVNLRRLMIGSTAPTCSYNECRGCKFKCKAEQIPVDANDPINSAYRYKCVCHR